MDGNRRYAKRERLAIKKGHEMGAENLDEILREAQSQGVKTLTLYTFSTENWNRSALEVKALLALLERFLRDKRTQLVNDGVRLKAIGAIEAFPAGVKKELYATIEATAQCQGIDLVLALNYGARDEIVRAAKRLVSDAKEGKVAIEEISESLFSHYLDTAPWPDPDLFIRTSGEMRLSNFLLWQMSYTELYMTKTLWPEFGPAEFKAALEDYAKRERRRGE